MFNFFKKKEQPIEIPDDFQSLCSAYYNRQKCIEDIIPYISNSQELWDFLKIYIKNPVLLRTSYFDKLEQYFKIIDMKEFYEYLKIAFIYCKHSELISLLTILTNKTEFLYHIKILQAFFTTYKLTIKNGSDLYLFITQIPKNLIPLMKPYLLLFNVTPINIKEFITLPKWKPYVNELLTLITITSNDNIKELYESSKNKKLYAQMSLQELWITQDTTDELWQKHLLKLLEKAMITNQDIGIYWNEINNLYNKELRDQCMFILLEYKPELFFYNSYSMVNKRFWKFFLSNKRLQEQAFVFINSFWMTLKPCNYQSVFDSDIIWEDKKSILIRMIEKFEGIVWGKIQDILLTNVSPEQMIELLDLLDKQSLLNRLILGQDIDRELLIRLTLSNKHYVRKFLTENMITQKALNILVGNDCNTYLIE